MFGSTPTIVRQQLPEIEDGPKDTPKDIDKGQQLPLRILLALATTPIVTLPAASLDAYTPSSDQTTVIEDVINELPIGFIYGAAQQSEREHESSADAANRTRLELLAREFIGGQLSTEEQARLAIVSERVRRLIPSVTAEDYEALETMLEDVRRIEAENIERLRRLGIG